MKDNNKWENFYKNTPLEKISWQETQADYLTEIIESGKVNTGTALDLGCGTGIKSVYLAEKQFQVTGIDISETAIQYAQDNAKKAGVKVNFVVADATDLIFLADQKFDLILDWANLHGIPQNKREKYIQEVIKHSKRGTKLILRCFGRNQGGEETVERPMGVISRFTKEEIDGLYGKHFKILESNRSEPENKNTTAPGKFFHEFLMEKL